MALFGQPSPDSNSPFYDDPLYGHPWQSKQRTEELRRERHRVWLSRLTPRDWAPIQALAKHVQPHYRPARLDDLDAKGIAVGVARADDAGSWGCGEKIGTLSGEVAVLVWRK